MAAKIRRYLASHPSWHRKQTQVQANRSYPSDIRVIAPSSFRPETLLPPYPAALPNSQTATIQEKLDELRILAAKFSFPEDARKILEWANIRFRMLDRQGWMPF